MREAPAHCGLAGVVPDAGLRFVVMVVMAMVVVRLGKCRGRNQRQQQGGEDDLLHGLRVAPGGLARKLADCGERKGANQERKQVCGADDACMRLRPAPWSCVK